MRFQGQTLAKDGGFFVSDPPYSSPEAIQNQPTTPAADVFSLGILFYELVAGADTLSGGCTGYIAKTCTRIALTARSSNTGFANRH